MLLNILDPFCFLEDYFESMELSNSSLSHNNMLRLQNLLQQTFKYFFYLVEMHSESYLSKNFAQLLLCMSNQQNFCNASIY